MESKHEDSSKSVWKLSKTWWRIWIVEKYSTSGYTCKVQWFHVKAGRKGQRTIFKDTEFKKHHRNFGGKTAYSTEVGEKVISRNPTVNFHRKWIQGQKYWVVDEISEFDLVECNVEWILTQIDRIEKIKVKLCVQINLNDWKLFV